MSSAARSEAAQAAAHFKTLGLTSTATEAQIKKAYRTLAIKLHPDKNPDLDPAEAAARFHPIQVAYDALLDPALRAQAAERAKEEGAREARMAQFGAKRKFAAEELLREEARADEKRRREAEMGEAREAKLARLKEEGKRRMEERTAREAMLGAPPSGSSSRGPGADGHPTRAAHGDALRTAGSVPMASERQRAAAAGSQGVFSSHAKEGGGDATTASFSSTSTPSAPTNGSSKTPIFSFKAFPASTSRAAPAAPSSTNAARTAASGGGSIPKFGSFNASTRA